MSEEFHAHVFIAGDPPKLVWLQCKFRSDGECGLNPNTYPELGPPVMVLTKPSYRTAALRLRDTEAAIEDAQRTLVRAYEELKAAKRAVAEER